MHNAGVSLSKQICVNSFSNQDDNTLCTYRATALKFFKRLFKVVIKNNFSETDYPYASPPYCGRKKPYRRWPEFRIFRIFHTSIFRCRAMFNYRTFSIYFTINAHFVFFSLTFAINFMSTIFNMIFTIPVCIKFKLQQEGNKDCKIELANILILVIVIQVTFPNFIRLRDWSSGSCNAPCRLSSRYMTVEFPPLALSRFHPEIDSQAVWHILIS